MVNLYSISRANELIELKRKNSTDVWSVISRIFEIWQESSPKRYNSYIIEVERVRNSRKDEFGSSGKRKSSPLRYTLDIPEFVIRALRALYTPDELPMNREFYHEFARRFPLYKVAEKI